MPKERDSRGENVSMKRVNEIKARDRIYASWNWSWLLLSKKTGAYLFYLLEVKCLVGWLYGVIMDLALVTETEMGIIRRPAEI